MKIILCLLAEELNTQNEEAIMKYDDENTVIHLLTNMAAEHLTMGMLLTLYEQLGIETQGDTEIWLMSDMPLLLQYASKLYIGLFDAFLKCPVPTDVREQIVRAYQYLFQCDNKKAIFLLQLIDKLRIVKRYTKIEAYYAHEKLLMRMQNDLSPILSECATLYHQMDQNERVVFECFAEEYAYSEEFMVFRILCLSLLLQMSLKPIYAQKIFEETRKAEYTADHKLYLCNQLKRINLLHPEIAGSQYAEKLYQETVSYWKTEFYDVLMPVTYEKRNRDKVVILTLQFLGTRHAPTKTANERIYTIGKMIGKEVLCINTREQYTAKGFLPFYDPTIRSIEEEYNGECRLQHKDYLFCFYQPEVEMPDREVMKNLLHEIRTMAPWQVVVLGDKCLLGDLCADMIPTVCIPMTFSTIPKKNNQYVAVGKQLGKQERKDLIEAGYQMSSVIESTFTFELTEQTTKLSREKLNLPKDKFLLAVIGIRLDSEVTKAFLDMLAQTYASGTHVVFAGEFETYDQLCNQNEGLKLHSSFVGYQKDILALMELCDLYVNPPRIGGGFSVVEAFCKGMPGITLNYGDVAASAGLDFCVDSLEEMGEAIKRYKEDSEFYHMMAEKALKRSKELFDSKGAMEYILNEMEQRELWF